MMNDYFHSLIANCASEWRPVVGFEGSYEVSSGGEIRSVARIVPRVRSKNGRSVSGRTLKAGVCGTGYKMVTLQARGSRRWETVHRIVVESHIGKIPHGMVIDHRNGDKSDNRIENLRIVTSSQNGRNKIKTNNPNGHRGVWFCAARPKKPWRADIQPNGKTIYLGSFVTKDEAIAARLAAELEYWGADAPSVVRS